MNPSEKPPVTKEEAEIVIKSIIGEVHTMGANDSEIPELQGIIEELGLGNITPEDAIIKAGQIRERKTEYH
jgi:hypothetical protein